MRSSIICVQLVTVSIDVKVSFYHYPFFSRSSLLFIVILALTLLLYPHTHCNKLIFHFIHSSFMILNIPFIVKNRLMSRLFLYAKIIS